MLVVFSLTLGACGYFLVPIISPNAGVQPRLKLARGAIPYHAESPALPPVVEQAARPQWAAPATSLSPGTRGWFLGFKTLCATAALCGSLVIAAVEGYGREGTRNDGLITAPGDMLFEVPRGDRNPEAAARLRDFLAGGDVIALTGAGISTESGIPDYRSPAGSYARGHKPITHAEFTTDARAWQRY